MYEIISFLSGPSQLRRIFLLQWPSSDTRNKFRYLFILIYIYVTETRRTRNLCSNLLERGIFMSILRVQRLSFPPRLSPKAYRSWFRDGKETRKWFWPRLYLHLGLRIHGVTTPITLTSSQCSVYSISGTTLPYFKNNDSYVVGNSKVNLSTIEINHQQMHYLLNMKKFKIYI